MDWLTNCERESVKRLIETYPVVMPGMFVQLDTWFGDVWAEIVSAYPADADRPTSGCVTFYRYEKYGVSRKCDIAFYIGIRKFARREEIDVRKNIVYTPTHYHSYADVVEWPADLKPRRDVGGYELHPTLPRNRGRQ